MDWIGVDSFWIIVMFLSAVWTRHPFTAEDPLVSKWCNAKFLQIWWRNTHLHFGWPESEDIFSRFSFLGDFFNNIPKYQWNIIHTKVQILLPITGSFQAPWSSLGACGEQYCLKWESRYLLDLGSILDSLWDGLVSVVAQEALKYTVLAGMSALLMQVRYKKGRTTGLRKTENLLCFILPYLSECQTVQSY